ncbi:MAG: GEVED domain-containing protein [Bacteroidota bacterium]
MKSILLLLTMLGIGLLSAQPVYKQKMLDPNVNFYDVVQEAETYFQTHSKGKGSGWKGYQRWKNENESRFYPTGDRKAADPHFAENAYRQFLNASQAKLAVFDSGWRDLGPYDANNITEHYSAGIGRVEAFWVNPNNDQHIYMGSRSGGFWRTTDGGATWENTTDYLIASGVNAIAVNPNNPDSVLINVRNANNATTHGIYRSTDGGLTWTQTAFNPTNLSWGGLGTNDVIYKIAYHPTIPDLVYVGTSRGLFRSANDLFSWSNPVNNGWITDIEFHPTLSNILYIYDDSFFGSNQNVVLISTNGGTIFSQSATLTNNNDARCYIATSPDCANCIYVGSTNGVWKSTNTGTSFTFLTNPNETCRGFAVSDLDDDNMIYGYVDLEASTNGGTSFTQVTNWFFNNLPGPAYVHADLRTAGCVNGVFYVGTDGYLCKSTDNGVTWTRLNDGTGIRENYAVGVSQSNWDVHMAGSQDNGTSILDETGWIEWNGGDGMEAIIQPLNNDWMIGSWQFGTRQRTKDGGQSRHGIGTPQSGSSQASWEAPLFFDPKQQMRVFHFSDSVFSSEEFGDNWQYVGSPPNMGIIRIAAIAQNNSNLIIAARGSDIRLSQDGGQSWASITSGLPGHSVTDIAFDPNDDQTIVVTYNRYQNDNEKVYISHNLGSTWTNITHNLGNMPIRSVAIDHSSAANIYVGAEIGVYYKPMNSNSWTLYNTNLPNVAVRDLEIQYGSNTIKAATWGRGLWDYHLVGRKDYPAILTTGITTPPTENLPLQNVDQTVTSVISYGNTLSSVYVAWSANGTALDNIIPMSNTVDSTWVSQSGIPGNLPANTEIFFKVFAIGSTGDTTETYRFMYTIHEFDYCNSNGNMDFTTAVTLVDFAGINNSTGKTQPYTDYTATDSAHVDINQSYNLTVHLDTDGNYQIFSKAWIDWNRNAIFTDPGEEYDLGSATNTADGPTTNSPLSILVPSNALPGRTTMRVSARYDLAPVPCGTGFDGEVEDYSIIVSNANCAPTSSSITVDECEYYLSPAGNTYVTSGTYLDTVLNVNGCDSLITIHLTVSDDTEETINPTACGSYTIPSGLATYTVSGVYEDTISNANGCDSTLIINLTIVSESFASLAESVCDSYTVPSGNETYLVSGIYQDTIANAQGCDSILTIDLTVMDIDTSLTATNVSLTVGETAATYQWIDCGTNMPIMGETSQTFLPTENGMYAVVVESNGCTDTSACFLMSSVGILDSDFGQNVRIFPNPTHGQFEIDLGGMYQDIQIDITDLRGKTIHQAAALNKESMSIQLEQAAGVYLVTVTADGKSAVFKLLKE